MLAGLYYFISVALSIGYVILMLQIMHRWDQRTNVKAPKALTSYPYLSIIIAARDEVDNIEKCIQSIVNGNYPIDSYEIIIVDDHSNDGTYQAVQRIVSDNVRVLKQKDGVVGKKAALSMAIDQAQGDWIVSTDADCHFGNKWLMSIASCIQYNDIVMLTAPVAFSNEDSFISMFQSMDIMGTMAVTLNGIDGKSYHMANGANLAFNKSAFYAVDGYQGNDNIASGDDMFLIQKMAANYPSKIRFLKSKDAICYTQYETSLSGFIKQRIRWASKSKAYQEIGIQKILVLVFVLNVSILVNFLLIPFFQSFTLFILLMQVLCKWSVDYLFLYRMATYFNKTHFIKWFLVLAPMHVLHIVASGFYGLFSVKTIWKGRKV